MKSNSIFVQIASYRDRELIPTIQDILAKAAYPELLSFGICWQHDSNERLDPWLHDRRFRVISVDWRTSKGCGWARNKVQQLYDDEEFTFQIDSHTRFIENWDIELIKMFRSLNDPKAIITHYPPPYEIKDGKIELCSYTVPQAITVSKFESDFIPYFGSIPLEGVDTADKPIKGRFLAAGMIFTTGQFCVDIPYNPNIYFLGEEIDIALRSFTKGYNIYHPHKSVCWHYFIRKNEPRHWEDHTQKRVEQGEIPINYVDLTTIGFARLKSLLWGLDINQGIYGLGNIRSKRDFELYAGINFKERLIHPDANKKLPPITTDIEWERNTIPLKQVNMVIELDLSNVPVLDDYDFWYFGVHDEHNTEIYRKDLVAPEYLLHRFSLVSIETSLYKEPKSWTLWPHSISKGWQTKIVKTL